MSGDSPSALGADLIYNQRSKFAILIFSELPLMYSDLENVPQFWIKSDLECSHPSLILWSLSHLTSDGWFLWLLLRLHPPYSRSCKERRREDKRTGNTSRIIVSQVALNFSSVLHHTGSCCLHSDVYNAETQQWCLWNLHLIVDLAPRITGKWKQKSSQDDSLAAFQSASMF